MLKSVFFFFFWQRSELRTVYNIQDEITLSSPIGEQRQSHTKLIADVAANSKNPESLDEMKTLMDSQTFLVYLFIYFHICHAYMFYIIKQSLLLDKAWVRTQPIGGDSACEFV